MADIDTSQLESGLRRMATERWGRVGDAFVTYARGECSRRTGALADSIVASEPVESGTRVSCEVVVGSEYGRFQNEGTGIYSPEGGRIYPTNRKALAFDWAFGGQVVVASVAGSPGTHFWDHTIDAWGQIVGSVS